MKNLSKQFIVFLLCFVSVNLTANKSDSKGDSTSVLETKTGKIIGTLLVPEVKTAVPVVLIISGSGPTDRDGNNQMMKNNSLKMLAEELYKQNIASLRYDKRGIGESKAAGKEENDLRFENYVNDAAEWIATLKKDKRFSKVIVIGHSEGSLIGMIAAEQANADAFVSLAGAGHSADVILKEQLKVQPPAVTALCYPMIDSLKKGKTIDSVPQMLYALFRPSVQRYMISWFKYDPQEEIKKLKIPVLILQGTTDIQVKEEDALALYNANKKAEYVLIKGMNHILKEVAIDKDKNISSYTNPDLPIIPELGTRVTTFIKEELK